MDTIIYRVHDCFRYPLLVQVFEKETGIKTVSVKSDLLLESKKPDRTTWLLNFDTGSALALRKNDHLKLPSHNHDIAYMINPVKKYVEINVSLPKFFFGNNVLDLIPFHKIGLDINSTNPYKHIPFFLRMIRNVFDEILSEMCGGQLPFKREEEIALDRNYNLVDKINDLHGLPRLATEYEMKDLPFDHKDVEINRVDIAINQYFNSKVDKLNNFALQRNILKKFQTPYKGSRTMHDSSIEVLTDRYYAKIYDKGAEFADIQRGNIEKEFNARFKAGRPASGNLDLSYRSIEFLQDLADKTLRYEITFRSAYMSYLFNNKVKKHWCNKFTMWKQLYSRITKDVKNRDFLRTLKRIYYYPDGTYSERLEAEQITKIEYKKYNSDTKSYVDLDELERHIVRFIVDTIGSTDYKIIKGWMKFMERELNKTVMFMMECDEIPFHKEYQVSSDGEVIHRVDGGEPTPVKQKFGGALLRIMMKESEEFFKTFQVTKVPPADQIAGLIDTYNAKLSSAKQVSMLPVAMPFMMLPSDSRINAAAKTVGGMRGIYKGSLMQIDRLIREGKSWDDIKFGDYFPKATFYRLKKKYEDVFGTSGNVVAKDNGIICNRDFQNIYYEIQYYATSTNVAHFYINAAGVPAAGGSSHL